MNESPKQRAIAGAVLLLALVLLAIGGARTHKVYDRQDDGFADFGLMTFSKLTDRDLVIDATFTGATRVGDKLYSTYDRAAPRGKKACPT